MRIGGLLAAFAALLFATSCGGGAPTTPASQHLALSDPIPDAVQPGVVLRIGDPVTQRVFEHLHWENELPFTIEWAEIAGGPAVTEAFHARALDVGSAANIPPVHAHWVGIDTRIVAVRFRRDPLQHPSFVLAAAPNSGIRTLADLRGKKIAFSPGQVQGEIVLRALRHAGIAPNQVTLVDLPSTSDVYTSALGSNLVDAAPIGAGAPSARYLAGYGPSGGRLLSHGPFRDDFSLLYARTEVIEDAAKAAALRVYVQYWARAQAWVDAHRDEWTELYYVQNQGVAPADARAIVEAAGVRDIPANWDEAIAYQQDAIDLLAPQAGRAPFDAHILFDRRFESVAAAAIDHPTAPRS